MNFDTYSLLKKFLDNGTFDGLDKIHAERACLKYEEAQEARKLKQEIHNTMMKNLIYDVIARADKPLRPRKFSLFFIVKPEKNILALPLRVIAVNFGLMIGS